MNRGRVRLAALLGALLVGGCQRDVRLLPTGAAGSGGTVTSGGGTGGAGTGGGPGGATAGASGGAACVGQGAPSVFPTAAGAVCASALATRAHRFALCSCDVMTLPAKIRTDAFDSTGASASDETSAAVGANGLVQTSAELRVGGAIVIAGSLLAADHVQSGGSLRVGGDLDMLSSNADVAADAYVGGNVSGPVRVTGVLHVPAAAAIGADVEAAATSREAVSVAAPCACGADFVDLASGLAAALAANQDVAAGISPDALANVTAPARLELGCGATWLSAIGAQAAVTLAVHGRAVLAVGGDVSVRAGLAVVLDPGAELDLLVGGHLQASGAGATLGTTAAPARFRIWVASTGTLALDDAPTLGATLHAPGAVVTAPSGVSLYGSILARSLAFGGDAAVHFDRAVLSAGAACGEPVAAPPP